MSPSADPVPPKTEAGARPHFPGPLPIPIPGAFFRKRPSGKSDEPPEVVHEPSSEVQAPAAASSSPRSVTSDGPIDMLPVLLVPGFVSSRLVAETSTLCPHWEGKPIWISLSRLGFHSIHAKGLWSDPAHDELKNKWLHHMCLKGPEEEMPGVHLKAVEGVDGVRCLDPESLFGLAAEGSRLFQPLIQYLIRLGYVEGRDFDAAPYDWRFAPSVLQQREGLFDKMITKIETLNSRNTGVVLLGHSMGNKVIHYFFEYAKKKKGHAWLSQNVYSWVAAGSPFLGSPQALRSTVQGMSEVRPLFSIAEAVLFARSLSASPWLFPIGSLNQRPCCFLRRQGVLEVRNLKVEIKNIFSSKRNTIMLTVEVDWGAKNDREALTTNSGVANGAEVAGEVVTFDEASNVMIFGGPPSLPIDASIRVIVKEKGMHDDEDKGSTLSKFGQHLKNGAKLFGEAINGRSGWGVPKAETPTFFLRDVLQAGARTSDGFTKLSVMVAGGTIEFEARYLDYQGLRSHWLGSQALAEGPGAEFEAPMKHKVRDSEIYDPLDSKSLLRMECPEVADMVQRYYIEDQYCDYAGLESCPPIKRMVAVHGVNVKTECMYALKVNTVRTKPKVLTTKFVLDDATELVERKPGRSMNKGMIYELEDPDHPSGDGTVTLASMEHCRRWADSLSLTVEHIPGAIHSTMLWDERFHRVVGAALTPPSADEKAEEEEREKLRAGHEQPSSKARLETFHPPPRGSGTRWQAAKDDAATAWWDCPEEVSERLTRARHEGTHCLHVEVRNQRYEVNLQSMTQRNLQTGKVRRLRAI
mmetsp:Transcript_17891/g.38348  ORF Transcript_17891/g.38348 Transcript_17891/m.38348 type:complete len:808 (+) Transcript_17891:97-2520(+)